jgi:Stage II sporulation protein E (SpoIIE)
VPAAERVSGDFYLVAEGPQDATVLVVGDVVGHGLTAARRAAFLRTAFAATAPFSDDPCRLLSWANAALIERAGAGSDFVTAACVSYLRGERCLRWAYAGHPPALWLNDGQELVESASSTPDTRHTRPDQWGATRRPARLPARDRTPRRRSHQAGGRARQPAEQTSDPDGFASAP